MRTDHEEVDPLTNLGYETSDVSIPKIRTSVMLFFGFAIVSAALGAGFMVLVQPKFWNNDQPKTAFTRKSPPPPNPILQNNITSKTDIEELRRIENDRINSTGWTDASKTRLHIPIDQAMDEVVAEGLSADAQAHIAQGAKR